MLLILAISSLRKKWGSTDHWMLRLRKYFNAGACRRTDAEVDCPRTAEPPPAPRKWGRVRSQGAQTPAEAGDHREGSREGRLGGSLDRFCRVHGGGRDKPTPDLPAGSRMTGDPARRR